jgi:dihydroflavonol-4-reductase
MKCIVTGATGHIGNVLVRNLYKNGYEVYAVVLPNDDHSMIDAFATILFGNILDPIFLESAFREMDIVFHLAGIVEIGSGKKKLIHKVNVEGTKNVLSAAINAKVKRFVYTSSVHAIPELPKPQIQNEVSFFDPKLVKGLYAKSKAEATQYVLEQKDGPTDIIIVHPSGVIGPYDFKMSNTSQMFVDFMLGRLTAYLRGGYNFVDVRDAAEGIRLAAEKGRRGECYILSGSEITVKELLDQIAISCGKKKIKTKLAYWFILAMSYFAELYYKIVRQKPLLTHYSIIVLNSNYHFSHQKATDELGYSTRDIKETIRETMEFSRDRHLEKRDTKYRKKGLRRD